jgi:hypothetical protein
MQRTSAASEASWDYPAIVSALKLDEFAVDDDSAATVPRLCPIPPVDVPNFEVVIFEIDPQHMPQPQRAYA